MVEQGSPEWFAMRAGKFTGSRFVDLTNRDRRTGKRLKSFSTAVWDVVVERLTGIPKEGVDSFSLRWGKESEPFAREAYELETGESVTETDFLTHPDFPFAGASPDGLIGLDGGLEIKCPKDSAIHLERFIEGIPKEYIPQVQGNLWVSGRQWWDFVSFDARMPPHLQLFRVRIERDEDFIQLIQTSVLEAEEEANHLLMQLTHKEAA